MSENTWRIPSFFPDQVNRISGRASYKEGLCRAEPAYHMPPPPDGNGSGVHTRPEPPPVWRTPLPLGIMRAMHSLDRPLPEPEFDVVLPEPDRTWVRAHLSPLTIRLDDAETHTGS